MKTNAADAAAIPVSRSRSSDFIALAKPRLNLLVVASAVAGYAMAGGDTSHVLTMVAVIAGTGLVAGGASAFNQIMEQRQDAQMRRTRSGVSSNGSSSCSTIT